MRYHGGGANRNTPTMYKSALLFALLGLLFVGLFMTATELPSLSRMTSTSQTEEAATVIEEEEEEKKKKTKRRDADGCYHVFIDGGANIGVHGRFLLEPEKYPNATVAHSIFDAEFGSKTNRDNRDFCVFEIEPNPAHHPTLADKQNAYAKMGWRYHVLNVGLSDRDGTLPFYRRHDVQYEEWGFSIRKFFADAERVDVPIIRFSEWLRCHVLPRELPTRVYGKYPKKNATIVVKLDIEGSEYVVLPDLISSGVLCQLDYVFGEFHSWQAPYDLPGLGVPLSNPNEASRFERSMQQVIRSFNRTCKTRFRERDDEEYLHDGIPLPTPPQNSNDEGVSVS